MDSAPCTVTLWHASGVEVPRELLAALSGPGSKGNAGGIKIKTVGDPFLALASLCRITREERQKRGEIEGPTNARLVIVYPELLTDAAELCAAADAYAPGVPRWQYGPAANPTLRPIVEQDVTRWGSRETPPPHPQVVIVPEAVRNADPRPKTSRTMPQLRLAGEGPAGGQTGGGGSALDNHPNPVDALGPTRLAGGPAEGPAPRSEPLITDEELRMLLGEDNESR